MSCKPHINLERKEDCCGCRSCEQICPQQCISMREDYEGFRYPVVDENKCIHCGLCVSRCPMLNAPKFRAKLDSPKVYAVRSKNENVLLQSSSGGMFSVLAKFVLNENGAVFGCAFDENLIARHICVENEADLDKLRGSKYVASDTNSTYAKVKKLLNEDRKVLYSGCGCQIAGLHKFLGKDYDNLLTMEIVCHGTPSQKLFSKHLEALSQTLGEKIISYEFRNKQDGWGLNCKIKTKTKTIFLPADKDPYYASFLRGRTYRPCCYECHFANSNKMADITVGDFWGIELFHPSFYDRRGISGVMLNTVFGKKTWDSVCHCVEYISSDFEKFSRRNGNLNAPTKKPLCRDGIYKGIDEIPYVIYSKKLQLHGKEKLISLMKNALPKTIRIMLNRVVFMLKGGK